MMRNSRNTYLAYHRKGLLNCPACLGQYPVVCDCGGLVHIVLERIDESGYTAYFVCDRCFSGKPISDRFGKAVNNDA